MKATKLQGVALEKRLQTIIQTIQKDIAPFFVEESSFAEGLRRGYMHPEKS